ncbi:hypothetical protein T459_25996 [Capsicum annuum]|uniref:Retrotransposon gag domain-containing protein n=1 Tax=Capsicum annuum TaxID=4072 RepID=A0A2G2YMC4_CAPAN|nr:hypothetical protein T459_25996 [Capsicum annuum]
MFLGINLPPHFKMPKFEKYGGNGDPVDHLRRYCNQLRGVGANEFMQKFQYNVELIADEKSLTNIKKKNTKSFREYAIRWREQAVRMKLPMKESDYSRIQKDSGSVGEKKNEDDASAIVV